MDEKQILTKAIEKAVANGWRPKGFSFIGLTWNALGQPLIEVDEKWVSQEYEDYNTGEYYESVEQSTNTYCWDKEVIIYSHDFAKALWNDDTKILRDAIDRTHKEGGGTVYVQLSWKYHLQQMVVADDPIAYLGEHLDA